MSLSYETASPNIKDDGAVECVWCGDAVAVAAGGEGLTITQGGPNNQPEETEDAKQGVRIRLECLECGATNVLLGVDQSE